MIIETQQKQITDYLLSKKLPIDVLLEVQDHFITQIENLQSEEKIDFDEAFKEVKNSWKNELKPSTSWLFNSFESRPKIALKSIKENYKFLFYKSSLIMAIVVFVHFILIFTSKDKESYGIYFQLFNSLFIIVPLFVWLFNLRLMKYSKTGAFRKNKINYTLYQDHVNSLFVSTISMVQIILPNQSKNSYYIFDFFRNSISLKSIPSIIVIVGVLVLEFFVVFGLLNFFEHKKAVGRIKNFLTTI